MSIKTTRYITREQAIARIKYILYLNNVNARELILKNSYECDLTLENIKEYIEYFPSKYVKELSNKALEELMDTPFIRYSMFENYIIKNDEED
jgi:hypothetical protein